MKRSRHERLVVHQRVHGKREQPDVRPELQRRWALVALILGVVVLASMFLYLLNVGNLRGKGMTNAGWSSDSAPPAPSAVEVATEPSGTSGSPELRIPVSDLRRNEARFFAYQSPSLGLIRFLVVLDANDAATVLLDTCKGCFVAGQGFVQQESTLVCRQCGSVTQFDELRGADHECQPVRVLADFDGTTLTVQARALEGLVDVLRARQR